MNQMSYPGGCGPMGGLFGIEQCYNDVQAVEATLTRLINDILAKNPNAFGQTGAITGVTDGSMAAPGQVGELVEFGVGVPQPAGVGPAVLTNMGTLPAGDWQVTAWVSFIGTGVTRISLDNIPTTNLDLTGPQELQLLPPGVGWFAVETSFDATSAAAEQAINLPAIVSNAHTSGPTPVIVRTITTSTAPNTIGVGYIARRMR